MSNHKHTSGPWSWGKAGNGLYGAGENNEVLTYAQYEGMWLAYGERQEANARLIAAAPELLAALIDCRNELAVMLRRHNERNEEDGSWRYDGQAIGEADEVIIKATGGDV